MHSTVGWSRLLAVGALVVAGLALVAQTTLPPAGAHVAAAGRTAKFPVSHFACYSGQFRGGKHPAVKFSNQFGRGSAVVGAVQRLCVPARKNAEPIVNGRAHLLCYALTRVHGPTTNHVVAVKNQFGTQRMTVVVSPPQSLCAPSTKAPVGAVPGSVPTTLDHYVCYSVNPSGSFETRVVKVGDQFRTSNDTVVAPRSLCLPTGKNGSRIIQPRVHLLCYQIKSPSKGHAVALRNQFGVLSGSPGPRDRLCVPSTKTIVS